MIDGCLVSRLFLVGWGVVVRAHLLAKSPFVLALPRASLYHPEYAGKLLVRAGHSKRRRHAAECGGDHGLCLDAPSQPRGTVGELCWVMQRSLEAEDQQKTDLQQIQSTPPAQQPQHNGQRRSRAFAPKGQAQITTSITWQSEKAGNTTSSETHFGHNPDFAYQSPPGQSGSQDRWHS